MAQRRHVRLEFSCCTRVANRRKHPVATCLTFRPALREMPAHPRRNFNMSLIVIGTLAYDTIETAHDKREDILGGSAVYFALASSRFSPTAMVGVVGKDFKEEHIELRVQGVTRVPVRLITTRPAEGLAFGDLQSV